MNAPVRHIHLQNIHKRFGAIRALRGVNLTLRAGEVHALLGQNGAGKSTLMKILYGLYQPDAGRILFDDQPVAIESPAQAIRLGLGFVQQHFSLVESLTVAENVALGALPARIYQPAALQTRIQEFIDSRGMAIDASARVADLSVCEKQRVEILKALYRQARFLILDEPTSVLSPAEIRSLFDELDALRRDGIGIVFISHKLAEVLEISDRITVLREGRVVGVTDAARTDASALTAMMMGDVQTPRSADEQPRPQAEPKQTVLAVENLHVRRETGGLALKSVSFELKAGDILGVAGVDGSGQKELVEAIMGLRAPARGRIHWPGGSPPRVGLIPADRMRQGLIPEFSVAENLLLAHADDPGLKSGPFYAPRQIEQWAREAIAQFGIVCRSPRQPVRELSGGNQQKLLVARAVHGSPPVLVAVNPTWGLDVAAAAAVHQRLRDLCRRGSAVLLVSTDLDEIYALSGRFFVLYNGRLMGWADPNTPVETVGRWMVGMADEPEARIKD